MPTTLTDASVLARYGAISEVAKFRNASGVSLPRGTRVVVRTHRGVEIATLLHEMSAVDLGAETDRAEPQDSGEFQVLRAADECDEQTARTLKDQCERAFSVWSRQILGWNLKLE